MKSVCHNCRNYIIFVVIGLSIIIGGGCSSAPDNLPAGVVWKKNSTYEKAHGYLDKGEKEQGYQHLKEAAREGYRNPFLYIMLAKMSGTKKEFAQGISYNLMAAEVLEGASMEVMYLNEVDMLKNEKNEVLCSVYSQHSALLYYSGDYNGAYSYADKALGLCSEKTSAQARDMKGRVALELGKYEEAIDMFRFLTQRSLKFSPGLFFLGKALVKNGQTDEGLVYLNQFVGEAKGAHPFVKEAKQLIASAKKVKKSGE